ncbi:hypothetical protein ACJMK2_043686 [Sinanodonta woodiana]|uniref:G-protein coupled receptors family 1 profile domain-containing protein n=1 Tax=Sinanodonta woodiana TaxID=1069815 RepID=A0ABD3W0W3_SINWO
MAAIQAPENISPQFSTYLSYLENATWGMNSTTNETFNGTAPFDTSTGYPSVALYSYTKYWITRYVSTISNYVIFVLTIFGSTSTIVTMVRMKSFYTTSTYMITLAATDFFSAMTKAMRQTRKLLNISYGDAGCRIEQFIVMTMPEVSNWIIVCVTVERFIAIRHPLKVATICTKRNTAIVLISVFVFFVTLNAHYLQTITEIISYDGDHYMCAASDLYAYFSTSILPYMEEFFYSVGPCICLFVLNICIINGLKNSNKMKQELSQNVSETVKEKRRQNIQLTRMLLCLSIMFFLFSMPASIFFIVQKYLVERNIDQVLNHAIGYVFVYFFSDLNQCMNFFVYIISGSRFREEFMKWFCCQEPKRHKQKILRSRVKSLKIYTMSDIKSETPVYTNASFCSDNETMETWSNIASGAD